MPDSIVRVGACRPLGWSWGVWVQGDYAYVATRSYLSVVDISNPSTPSVVSNFDDGSGPLGIFLVDSLVYVNDGGWFTVVNVSDPESLSVVGSCFVPVLTEPKGVSVVGTNAYVAASDSGLQIVDISDPSSPSIIGRHHTPARTKDLFVDGSLAYLADGDSLQIIDVSDPTTPFRVGAAAMPSNCYDVFIVDTFAYVACQSGFGFGSLEVVNVSDPSSPQIVASVDNIVGDPLDVWVSGDYAYVAAADYSPVEGGVRVVDVSDPLSPSLVASYDTPGDPRGVFAVDDLVFVADYDSLQILRHIATGINESTVEQQPAVLRLRQNQPNPFTYFTTIRYEVPTAGSVTLEIHDVTGRLVRTLVDGPQTPGPHTTVWDGSDEVDRKLASGIYFYRLTAQGSKRCGKMILLR